MLVADNLVVQRYAIEHMWFLQTWHLVINFAFGLVSRHHAAALIYYAFGYCQAQLDSLLAEYSDVFTPLTGLPPDRPVGHTIPLEPGNRPPATPMYRLSKPEHDELKQQIQDLLAKDYRQLNKITLRDLYPLPRIDDLFDKLSGCKIFSSLDLQAGYHQIRITPEDVPKTAFRTPEGHFQFKVLCFGLTNAPATFQRVMNDAFASVLGKCALVYLDDILVMSRAVQDHLLHLKQVFELLRKNKLYAKLSKYVKVDICAAADNDICTDVDYYIRALAVQMLSIASAQMSTFTFAAWLCRCRGFICTDVDYFIDSYIRKTHVLTPKHPATPCYIPAKHMY
ncbi:hypothetical protein QJQ45_010992 [Haematococcus lacustris]|nr:hypothetical protein QJQ45_010992 [Haematococcus lacustris]